MCPVIANSLSSTSAEVPLFLSTTLRGGYQELEPKWPTGEEPHQLIKTNAHAALRRPTPAQSRLVGVIAIKMTSSRATTAVSSQKNPTFLWYS